MHPFSISFISFISRSGFDEPVHLSLFSGWSNDPHNIRVGLAPANKGVMETFLLILYLKMIVDLSIRS